MERIDTYEESDFVLSEDLNDYTLEDCLNTTALYEVLQQFDLNIGNNSVKRMCEEFGVKDVGKFKQYEYMAKNSNCYFTKLLKDYAVNEVTVENTENNNVLKNLDDLQRKLWNLKSGKLTCKSIKKRETDILTECLLKKKDNSKNEFVLSLSLHPKHRQNIPLNVENNDYKVKIVIKDSNEVQYSRSESIESNSLIIGGTPPDFNNNQFEKIQPQMVNNKLKSKITRKINVNLYYHPKQDKSRIENFINEANSLKPNIIFSDLSTQPIEQLKIHVDNDVPMFIFFDKNTENIVDTASSTCQCDTSLCGCATIKEFFKLLYQKYLNNDFEKFFTFIMDDWEEFTKKSQFKYKWLLKFKTSHKKAPGKIVRIKPYFVPATSQSSLCQKFEYFLLNFNYPNYSFVEFDNYF